MKEQVRLDGLLFSSDAQVLRVMNPSGHDHRSGGRIRRKAEGEGRLPVSPRDAQMWHAHKTLVSPEAMKGSAV
jgi:hypothetical protein